MKQIKLRYITEGCQKKSNINFFQIGVEPPPLKILTFEIFVIFFQFSFISSQNLKQHILVLSKPILKHLFTAYTLCKNVHFGVDPSPFLDKVYIFFWHPFISDLVFLRLLKTATLQNNT